MSTVATFATFATLCELPKSPLHTPSARRLWRCRAPSARDHCAVALDEFRQSVARRLALSQCATNSGRRASGNRLSLREVEELAEAPEFVAPIPLTWQSWSALHCA